MAGTSSPYSGIYAFGDSLSDAGNDSILTSATTPEPVSPPYFHTNYSILGGIASEAGATFSNGPVWVQDLSLALGLGTLEPSLLGGNDFAYGGAETGSTPQDAGNTTVAAISLPEQLTEFSVEAGKIAANALVTISVGANDIFAILSSTTLSAAQQATDVTDAVNNEVAALQTLASDGARNFLIFNVPDLGLVPEVTQGLVNGSNTPSATLDTLAANLSASYNSQLAADLASDSKLDGATVDTLNSYALIQSASVDPSAYGLTNTSTPVWSGNFTSTNSGTLAATSLVQQNQYLFWDDYHPTAAVHQILANQALALVDPTSAATQATVTGASGATLTIDFATAAIASQAQAQFSVVSAEIASGAVTAELASGQTLPILPSGSTGFAQIGTSTQVLLPGGYTTEIDLASGPVSLISTQAGSQLVVQGGTGDLLYSALKGAETVYAGSGNALLFGNAASLDVLGGNGAATIIGGSAGNSIAGGGGNQLVFGTSTLTYSGGGGAATIIGGTSGNTITGGAGTQLIFGSSSMRYAGGSGAATLVGGTAGSTVSGGGGGLLVFGTSALNFSGGGGSATVVGNAGAVNATLGSGGGLAFGSTNGNNSLATGSGQSTIVGGGGGDVLTATGSGNNLLVAAGGAETLNGAAATGNLTLYAGSGADNVTGGSGTNVFVAGTGNDTLAGGGGVNVYLLLDDPGTSRDITITNFNPATSTVVLYGYGSEPSADNAALGSAVTTGGNTMVSLSDGTHILFTGAPALQSSNFA
jgi:phospholipase/lecithinase/hemolysin